jgi:3-phosphoshikimate 1-carboxyvinyltransferase
LFPRTHYLDVPSAQVKSALILASLSAAGETIIDLPEGGRDHTENMLAAVGAPITSHAYLGRERISVIGPWRPKGFKCEVPTDPSSVAFFAGLAALHPGLRVKAHKVMRNKTRTGFFRALEAMGLEVSWTDLDSSDRYLGEDVGTVSFLSGARPRALTVPAARSAVMLDEIPMLAAVCALASGRSRIEGLAELRVKESDRLARISELLTKAGIEARIDGDALEIEGKAGISAFSFGSDDHRMVMTAMILATKGNAPSDITGISWINTSFPLFLTAFQNINLAIQ